MAAVGADEWRAKAAGGKDRWLEERQAAGAGRKGSHAGSVASVAIIGLCVVAR